MINNRVKKLCRYIADATMCIFAFTFLCWMYKLSLIVLGVFTLYQWTMINVIAFLILLISTLIMYQMESKK
jgi:hypothetical protein